MLLIRTVCNTDWKGRPDHGVMILGKGTIEELVRLREADVLDLIIEELVEDNRIDLEESEADEETIDKSCEEYKAQLLNLGEEKLKAAWEKDGERWEMERSDKLTAQREFAWSNDGNFSSIVYTFVEEV